MTFVKSIRQSFWLLTLSITLIGLTSACTTTETSEITPDETPTQTQDVFKSSTGGTNYKGSETTTNPADSCTPTKPVMPNASIQSEWQGPIFLVSDGDTFVSIIPDLKPHKKYKFTATDVYWAKKNGDIIRRVKSFYWVMPDEILPDAIFWLKYSGKFDIKLNLDKPFTSWASLFDANILTILEDDFGKNNNLGINNCWYFTPIDPVSGYSPPENPPMSAY